VTELGYLRPPWYVTHILNRLAQLTRRATTLAVRGRTSGQWRTTPVNVLSHEGNRYLVAPRGETQWARNLRVAGEGELRRGRRVETFRAVEVPAAERAPIVEAYLERFGGQPGVRALFAELPDPADHPAFRLEPSAPSA
jgi:deazaflavin-dependent oxidoreductase (nitroreductase family)